jgi:pyruvate ferredoxin oxidoreductase alpha subunit
LDEVAEAFAHVSGRRYDVVETYRLDGAESAVVCLGSTGGTIKDAVDSMRDEGDRVGLLELRSFRPLPVERLRSELRGVANVAVLDRADSPGGRPPLYAELSALLDSENVQSFVYGLGGRELHPEDVPGVFAELREAHAAPTYVGLRGEPCPA